MSFKQRVGMLAILLVCAGIGFGLGATAQGTAVASSQGGRGGSAAGPRYTVVATEATNLIVTDNGSNTLYFYTVDRGQEPGAPLKLRGTVDLNSVGKPEITPTRTTEKP
jgi:hypothetical protein